MSADWTEVSQSVPPNGVVVDTVSPNGLQQKLKRIDNLWFSPDGAIYMYYTPARWRHVD